MFGATDTLPCIGKVSRCNVYVCAYGIPFGEMVTYLLSACWLISTSCVANLPGFCVTCLYFVTASLLLFSPSKWCSLHVCAFCLSVAWLAYSFIFSSWPLGSDVGCV